MKKTAITIILSIFLLGILSFGGFRIYKLVYAPGNENIAPVTYEVEDYTTTTQDVNNVNYTLNDEKEDILEKGYTNNVRTDIQKEQELDMVIDEIEKILK